MLKKDHFHRRYIALVFHEPLMKKREKALSIRGQHIQKFVLDRFQVSAQKASTKYTFDNGDIIFIACYDWSEETGKGDHFRYGILSNEFAEWVRSAHK